MANGPAFKKNYSFKQLSNIEIYNLLTGKSKLQKYISLKYIFQENIKMIARQETSNLFSFSIDSNKLQEKQNFLTENFRTNNISFRPKVFVLNVSTYLSVYLPVM